MPKLFPTFQEFMDLRNGTKVGVTRVVMKSTSDYVIIPNAYDATGLQVTASAFAALVWILENPKRGIIEPEDLDFDRILQLAQPYLGRLHGRYTKWIPLQNGKNQLFPQDVSLKDQWQFKNFRIL